MLNKLNNCTKVSVYYTTPVFSNTTIEVNVLSNIDIELVYLVTEVQILNKTEIKFTLPIGFSDAYGQHSPDEVCRIIPAFIDKKSDLTSQNYALHVNYAIWKAANDNVGYYLATVTSGIYATD